MTSPTTSTERYADAYRRIREACNMQSASEDDVVRFVHEMLAALDHASALVLPPGRAPSEDRAEEIRRHVRALLDGGDGSRVRPVVDATIAAELLGECGRMSEVGK